MNSPKGFSRTPCTYPSSFAMSTYIRFVFSVSWSFFFFLPYESLKFVLHDTRLPSQRRRVVDSLWVVTLLWDLLGRVRRVRIPWPPRTPLWRKGRTRSRPDSGTVSSLHLLEDLRVCGYGESRPGTRVDEGQGCPSGLGRRVGGNSRRSWPTLTWSVAYRWWPSRLSHGLWFHPSRVLTDRRSHPSSLLWTSRVVERDDPGHTEVRRNGRNMQR